VQWKKTVPVAGPLQKKWTRRKEVGGKTETWGPPTTPEDEPPRGVTSPERVEKKPRRKREEPRRCRGRDWAGTRCRGRVP